MTLKVKAAIKYYNANRKEGEPKITQRSLGIIIMPEKNPVNSENYIYRLIKGNSTCENHLVPLICKACRVDANFLYGVKPMEK